MGQPRLDGALWIVAFGSGASDLVAPGIDTNDTFDVYVLDRDPDGDGHFDGRTRMTLVSTEQTGAHSAEDQSTISLISRDGRYVAFASLADNVTEHVDDNENWDGFVLDRDPDGNGTFDEAGLTAKRLVTVNRTGTAAGNGALINGDLSADGRHIVFSSEASDLVTLDNNGESDVFAHDVETETTRLVSGMKGVEPASVTGNDDSRGPVTSADGRYVAFRSGASDLVPHDGNGFWDIFVRDRETETTTLVSINWEGTGSANGGSRSPAISADGRFVAFSSRATDLVEGIVDANDDWDVFLRDRDADNDGVFDELDEPGATTTTLISTNYVGTGTGNDGSGLPVVSASGYFVAFISNASDLVSDGIEEPGDSDVDDTNGTTDVYRWNRGTGITELVSINHLGTGSANGLSFNPALNESGRAVVFQSLATDLIDPADFSDTNGGFDVFLRAPILGTQRTLPISINREWSGAGNGPSYNPSVSANGMSIAFVSEATDLVYQTTHETDDPQVFLFTFGFGEAITLPVSVDPTGHVFGNGASGSPVISADGWCVAFQSIANNLVDQVIVTDNNETWDVFVRGVLEGLTGLVSVDHTGTESANGPSGPPVMSSDGTVVAFPSEATNLVDPDLIDDSNDTTDAFARYMILQRTIPLSLNAEWTKTGNGRSFGPVVSANGRFVAFESDAGDLIRRDRNESADVFGVSLLAQGGFRVTAYSPVDIVVTDPEGNVVSRALSQVPDAVYLEQDLDGDGDADDQITIPAPLTGAYLIELVPEPGADPGETVTLVMQDGAITTTLLDDVPVEDLPAGPIEVWVDRTAPLLSVEAAPEVLFPAETFVSVHVNVLQLEDETDPDPQVALVSIEPSWLPEPGSPVIQGAEYGTNDGDFELLAARGAEERTYVVTYAATDASGNVGHASVTVYVGNHRPVAEAGPDQTAPQDAPVSFDGTTSSDADGDSLTFAWDFGDGTTGTGPTPTHVYADPGLYTATLTVDDGYFGGTDIDSLTVVIAGAAVDQGVLQVVGTPGDDHVLVTRSCGRVFVTANFLPGRWHTKGFDAAEIERIDVVLGQGNDAAVIARNVGRPAKIDGGPGDDRLKGSWSDDILLGDGGDDLLVGSGGRDLMIGGTGRDRIVGNWGDDLLIAGTTLWDSNDGALMAIMAEWTSDRSFVTRVKNIRGLDNPEFGERLNRNENEAIDYFFSPDGAGEAGTPTVFDDFERDMLIGGLGHDWFLANIQEDEDDSGVRDRIFDLTHADFADDLEFVLEAGEE